MEERRIGNDRFDFSKPEVKALYESEVRKRMEPPFSFVAGSGGNACRGLNDRYNNCEEEGGKRMTMKNNKCEVCNVNEPIGVASTVMPYSCAYCVECIHQFAQPRVVFECFFEDFGTEFETMNPDYIDLVTFHDGKYITYREWAKWREGQVNANA